MEATPALDLSPEELSNAEPIPSEWTDKKHTQYLKTMEASFVNQLYDSMELLGRHSVKENLSVSQSRRHDKCVYSPSGQFKVQRDGCWKKINFEGHCSPSNTSAQSHVFLTSSWIRHFKSTSGPLTLDLTSDLSKLASSTNHPTGEKGRKAFTSYPDVKSKRRHVSVSYLLGQALIGNNAEVSDQNFADDDDLGVTDQNGSCSAKRSKTLGTDPPFDDQVVPLSEAALNTENPGDKQSFASI